jgi:hypothetical protein
MADLLWRPTLLTTETFLINSATSNETGFSGLTNGGAVVSTVSGASGVFSPLLWGHGQYGEIWFNAGGAFTPAVNGALLGWFLLSLDGGTTFETQVATPSASIAALERAPDFIIPFSNAAHASGHRVKGAWPVRPPPVHHRVLVQNRSGVTLPNSTTNWLRMISTTFQAV